MLRSRENLNPRRGFPLNRRTPTVCVVDQRGNDYPGWESVAQANGAQLHFAATAPEALRLARTATIDLWVVSTDLAGMAGEELCSMLRQCNRRAAVYLVTESDSPESQRAAWAARPTLVGCKGEHHALLAQWLNHRQNRPTSPFVA